MRAPVTSMHGDVAPAAAASPAPDATGMHADEADATAKANTMAENAMAEAEADHPPAAQCGEKACEVCAVRDCRSGSPLHYHSGGCQPCLAHVRRLWMNARAAMLIRDQAAASSDVEWAADQVLGNILRELQCRLISIEARLLAVVPDLDENMLRHVVASRKEEELPAASCLASTRQLVDGVLAGQW
jgi:hypothetical protein